MRARRLGKPHVWRLNYDSHMISGCRNTPEAGAPGVRMIDWMAETFKPPENSGGLSANSSIQASSKRYKAVYKYESLTHLFGGLLTEGR
jgi:hypothetical protein